jgi:hypothetical protein
MVRATDVIRRKSDDNTTNIGTCKGKAGQGNHRKAIDLAKEKLGKNITEQEA